MEPESGSVVSQILQPFHTLGHGRMCAKEVGKAARPQGIDDVHLRLGRIYIHGKPVIASFQLEQSIRK